jgi:anti-anti-sigma factor
VQVRVKTVAQVAVLEVTGKLSQGDGPPTLHRRVLDVLDRGFTRVLIDLGEVTAADSSGLGELIRCQATCSRRNASLGLTGVAGKLRTLFAICRLGEIIPIHADGAGVLAAAASGT